MDFNRKLDLLISLGKETGSLKIEDIIKAASHVFASKPRYFANVKQNVYDNYQEFFNTLK